MSKESRPLDLTVDRGASELRIQWLDGHHSRYALDWVRANCPCATCREERFAAALEPLRLHSGSQPSAEVVGAELVGNYAIRINWGDGHNSGIYPFSALRQACPCPDCSPEGPRPLLQD